MGIIHLLASSFHFFPSCSGQDRNKTVCEKSPLIWLTGVQSSQNQPKISCGGWGKSRNLVTKLCHSSLVFSWVGFSISEISTGHTALGQQEKELQTDPKSSKSQPKVDFREAPRSLQVLPPTDISKCTEMLNLEPHPSCYARHKDPSIQCILGTRGEGFSSSSCENNFIEFSIWCWWQKLKQRFHPKSFGINVILNSNFRETRISA